MIRAVVLALAMASAAAFAPVKAPVSRSSVVTKAFETEIGAQQPLGFWDPLGLLENADQVRRWCCVDREGSVCGGSMDGES